MCERPDPFVFPELPDEAAAALDQFLEDFYTSFQNHYCVQLYRWYRAFDEREARHRRSRHQRHRSGSAVLKDPEMTAAKTPRSRSMMAHHQS